MLRAFHAGGMEAINLKISKVGGLTRARQIRELAETLGIRLTIEDTWGGDLVTAAVSHLAASVRPEALFTVSFMNDWTNEHVAGYEPRSRNGIGAAPPGPRPRCRGRSRDARRAALQFYRLNRQDAAMGFDQYHEPPEELPPATRTFARLCASLTEEAEAIGWYEQRLAVEADREASAIMRDAQGEEFKHFCMDLEFLLRRTPLWREIAQGILFQEGDIVEHGEEAEEQAVEGAASRGEPLAGSASLGIGSLRGASL